MTNIGYIAGYNGVYNGSMMVDACKLQMVKTNHPKGDEHPNDQRPTAGLEMSQMTKT